MIHQLSGVNDAAPETVYHLSDYDSVAPTGQLESKKLMYDLMAVRLKTNSPRVISLFIAGRG